MTSVSIISGVAARIKDLMNEPNKQPKIWSDDAKQLPLDLERICRSLKGADQETKRSEKFVKLEKRSVRLSYDIDDAIAAMEMGLPSKQRGKISGMLMRTTPERGSNADLASLRQRLERITKKIHDHGLQIQKENNSASVKTRHQADPTSPTAATSKGDLPRMENEVKADLLKQELPVVCIWGESGMGKTTLAKKVFDDPEVRRNFQVFAWVPINQDFQTKSVLQEILLQLLPHWKADIRGMDEIELTEHIFTVQKEKRCLVVLEDIGTVQDWLSIRVAFPIGNSISKIFITTPLKEVGELATSKGGVYHSIARLTEEECRKILKERAKFDDAELETVGKIIFSLSEGSPLFAEILGKSLKTVDVAARDRLVRELDKYRSQSSEGEKQVLELCYHKLPDELKPCLLYMGQFPQGQDIEVEKLHLLMAAEDLISPEDSGTRKSIFMQSVRNILHELSRKKLVEAQENKASMARMYKPCQLHDQVRKFCIFKGLDEEFFDIVDFESGKQTKKLEISAHRLAIYLSKYKDGDAIPFRSQDTVKKIRALLIFDTYESEAKSAWPSEVNDLKDFSRLRVLDFDGVNFSARKFPRGIDKLVFLRYLSFRGCWLEAFPSSVSKLPCLETLDLRVRTDRTMTIPHIFSNMKRLRHLYFPMMYKSDGKSKLQLQGLERLEILVNFDTGACDVNDLSQLKNLQILTAISEGNRKDLEAVVKFLEEKAANLQSSVIIRNFDCYTRDRVTIFKKLLECKSLHSLHIEGQIGQFPKDVTISPNFTEMLFDGSELEDDPMNVLGKLENLRSLVLSNDAFVGNEMLISAASKFPNLRSLKLLKLQYLERLTFEKGAMPKLSTLVIDKCDYLEKVLIPEELHNRLQRAQGKKGDDGYLVEPLPAIIE